MRINIIKLLQPRSVSHSESRRLVTQGAVRVNGAVVANIDEEFDVKPGDRISIGKHEEIEITEEFLEGKKSVET